MSEHYKALTRKYRPVTFDDIVSQQHVSETLKNAIEGNRLSHAYLFCGPRGVGKTTMARVLARTINEIETSVDGEALNQTLNIIEVDAASNNKVEDAGRIREAVRIPPQSGKYKIFIIDEVHMLTKSAFNALLKTLEEPPAHAIFIFATTEPHKVLPTILSRVQRFDFKPISVTEIVERLKIVCEQEKISIDDESLHIIARKADGALRDALGLLDQVIAFCGSEINYAELQKTLNVVGTDRLFELTEHIKNSDSHAGIKLVNQLLIDGHDIQEFLIALTEHLRNLLLSVDKRNMFAIEASDEVKQRLAESAGFFTEEDLLRMLHIVHEAQFKIREAQQPKILLEITVLKLIRMERSEGLKALLKEINLLKKSLGEGASIPSKSSNPAPTPSARPTKPAASAGQSKPTVNEPVSRVSDVTVSQNPEPGKSMFGNASLSGLRPRNGLKPLKKKEEKPETGNAEIYEGNLALAVSYDKAEDQEKENIPKKQTVYLHEVSTIWEKYIDGLNEAVPSFVRITLQSTKPIDVKSKELILQCNDDLAARLIEEHRETLADNLEGIMGQKLRLRCVVRESEKKAPTEDPYTRFKELQKKDPRVKTIVDLFGAEIEYVI